MSDPLRIDLSIGVTQCPDCGRWSVYERIAKDGSVASFDIMHPDHAREYADSLDRQDNAPPFVSEALRKCADDADGMNGIKQ